MGIMVCPTHARSEFVEICSHVAAQIDDGKQPSGHRFDYLGHLLICDECFHSLGFDKCSSLKGLHFENDLIEDSLWDAYSAAYEAIEDRQAFCLKCFSALQP
jgi:hypothetical protein